MECGPLVDHARTLEGHPEGGPWSFQIVAHAHRARSSSAPHSTDGSGLARWRGLRSSAQHRPSIRATCLPSFSRVGGRQRRGDPPPGPAFNGRPPGRSEYRVLHNRDHHLVVGRSGLQVLAGSHGAHNAHLSTCKAVPDVRLEPRRYTRRYAACGAGSVRRCPYLQRSLTEGLAAVGGHSVHIHCLRIQGLLDASSWPGLLLRVSRLGHPDSSVDPGSRDRRDRSLANWTGYHSAG